MRSTTSLLRLLSIPTSLSIPPSSLSFPTPFVAINSSVIFSKIRVSAMSTEAGSRDNNNGVVKLALSPSSSLKIQKGDITQWSIDGSSDAIMSGQECTEGSYNGVVLKLWYSWTHAVALNRCQTNSSVLGFGKKCPLLEVNAANERMLGGGGVDGAIHRAAGPELKEACYKVPEVRPGVRCPTGEARITPGFRLPASHVIHTVGPIYDVVQNPEVLLKNAYRNSLMVAKENNIQYIAFPAISCGVYGYPFDEAATIAVSTVEEFANDFKEVSFVLFSDDIYNVWLDKAKAIVEK